MKTKVNDEIRLENRKTSKFIQVVIKSPDDGEWIRRSAKTMDEAEAIEFAREKLAEWKYRKKTGLPTENTKNFEAVAKKYRDKMKVAIDAGAGNSTQKNYVGIIDNWLIPFFGSSLITNIDGMKVEEFEGWRKKKMGREPAKNTINSHNIVLRAILDYALQNKLINNTHVPKLTIKNKGRKSERRGFFTAQEWNALIQFLTKWRNNAEQFTTKYKRDVLRSYVYFITMSGIRPGQEADSLKWSDFEFVPKTKKQPAYYRVYIRHGKKSDLESELVHRKPVITVELYKHLRLLLQLRSTKHSINDLVFCMPDGAPIKGLSEMFRNALTLAGMYRAQDGSKRTLYSLRHTYATWKLGAGASYEQLRTQLGTSIQMLQKHYDHSVADTFASELLL